MTVTLVNKLQFKNGNATFQYLAALTGTLTIITSGMHYGWPSPSLPKLLSKDSSLSITDGEGSWLAVMSLIGSFFGAPMASTIINMIGRKKTILLTAPPYFAAWIMVAYAKSFWFLCFARFLAGVVDSIAFNCVPIYIGEIASPQIRGRIGSSVSVTWIFGVLLINIIGSYLTIQMAALLASILPLVSFLTFIWMPESPYYMLIKQNESEARNSLQTLRGKKDVDDELVRLSTAVKEQMTKTGRFLDLFTVKSNRRAVFVMIVLRAAQQLSGTTAIAFYTIPIFKEGGEVISPELATIIYFTVQLVLATVCSSIVDKAGRRPLLIISLSGASFALLIQGVYFYIKTCTDIDVSSFSFLPVAALIGFVIIFTLGGQVIPLVMLGELFPISVKGHALCFACLYYCILATVVSKFFQIMKDSLGMYTPFFTFSGCCILAVIFIYMFVPETKGKTLEEIQMYFSGEHTIKQKESKIANEHDEVEKV